MRIIVIEADKRVADNLLAALRSLVPGTRILLQATDPKEVYEYLVNKENERPDLFFSAQIFPGGNSISLLEKLQEPLPVVWISQITDPYVPWYLISVDQLENVFTPDRIGRALNKFQVLLQYVLGIKKQLDNQGGTDNERKFLLVKYKKEYHKIRLQDIAMISCKGSYVIVHTISGAKYSGLFNLSKIEAGLPTGHFFRVSRNCLVPVALINSYKIGENGKVTAFLGVLGKNREDLAINISRNRIPEFRSLFESGQFE